jgi:hypothetical protein
VALSVDVAHGDAEGGSLPASCTPETAPSGTDLFDTARPASTSSTNFFRVKGICFEGLLNFAALTGAKGFQSAPEASPEADFT